MLCHHLSIQAIASSIQIQIPIISEVIQKYFLPSGPLPTNPVSSHEVDPHFEEFKQMMKKVGRRLKPCPDPERPMKYFAF
jgi:hypothetical protein